MKRLVVKVLNRLTANYISRHKLKVIAVVGSVGKTTMSEVLRTVLSEKYRVLQPKTNYNTEKSIHCSIFDETFATNIFGWALVSLKIAIKALTYRPRYNLLVLELSTDKPGDIMMFDWLRPYVTVITAITPEHMANFADLDAVAEEELSVQDFSRELIANISAISKKHRSLITKPVTFYGQSDTKAALKDDCASVEIDGHKLEFRTSFIGEHSLQILSGAAVTAKRLGLSNRQISSGLEKAKPVPGRMQLLAGAAGSQVIDDSYNASPDAVIVALKVLYRWPKSKKIALLGNMNELGAHSASYHREVGEFCDPKKLDLLVTLGPEANKYLADTAEAAGCRVVRAMKPDEAGELIKKELNADTVVLVKGSQNKVYAEEAIKHLLDNPADEKRLVRQSAYWQKIKQANFR